jgi:tetratricopeptide (TPR) repeat protein
MVDAVRLLCERTGDRDSRAAEAVAKALGRLPLALEQAAAYAEQQILPLARYLALFEERRAALLARGRAVGHEPGTVDATFSLAVDQLADRAPAAVHLLELCTLLSPDQLPLDLLLSRPHLLHKSLSMAVQIPLEREEIVGQLYRASLLAPDVGGTARIHRLVQAVVLAHLPGSELHQLLEGTALLLAGLWPNQPHEPAGWSVAAKLLPHTQALLGHADVAHLDHPAVARLLNRAGTYIWGRGLGLPLAQQLHEQALQMCQRLFQGDHPEIATSLNNLAIDLSAIGEMKRARELDEEALAMCQRLYEGDHPDTAANLANLAADLRALGDVGRARELDEEALAMCQRLYQGDHPDTAASLANLAADLNALGENKKARELRGEAEQMRRMIAERERGRVFGETDAAPDDQA